MIKLGKKETEPLNKALRYYKILCAVGDIPLQKREIQLLAFTAIKGNISYSSNKEEFCNTYNSSSAYINNMISKMKKLNVLVKDNGKIKVNPKLLIDFSKNINILLTISNG